MCHKLHCHQLGSRHFVIYYFGPSSLSNIQTYNPQYIRQERMQQRCNLILQGDVPIPITFIFLLMKPMASLHRFTPYKSHNHNRKCQSKQGSVFRSRKKLSCPQHYIFHCPWLLSNLCLAQQKKETCFLWSRPNFFFSKATCLLYSTQPEVKRACVWLADNSKTTFAGGVCLSDIVAVRKNWMYM